MSQTPAEDSGVADAFRTAFAAAREANPATAAEPVLQVAQQPVEQVADATPTSTAAGDPPPSDELSALRAELAEAKAEAERYRTKGAESIEWARKGFLRKSSEADRATSLLRRAAEAGELDADELAAFLQSGGQQPAASAPQPGPGQWPYQQVAATDDRMMLDASQFVFDYALSDKQAESFTAWLNGEGQKHLTERDFVPGDHYSTLRHGYEKFRQVTAVPDPALAAAAATVARTQREIARGAAASPGQMPTPAPVPADPMKMTVEQRESSGVLDAAFRELANTYRQ